MTAERWQDEVEELHRQAKLHRKRGDAFRRGGSAEKAAAEFRAGAEVLDEIISRLLANQKWSLEHPSPNDVPPSDLMEIARELVEAYGARGGMLRRLGDSEAALESYRKGAEVEENLVHRSTYNRVNAIKLALLSGASSLDDLSGDISHLEKLLTRHFSEHQELSDSGWAWADLGDCRALLGDVPGAESAYRTFTEKAGSSAPNATLEVLRQICDKLDQVGDSRAGDVRASLRALEARLA